MSEDARGAAFVRRSEHDPQRFRGSPDTLLAFGRHGACMSDSDQRAAALGDACVGDAVIAEDGELGRIESVVRSEVKVPLFMIIATGRFRRRRPVLSCALVEAVDRANRRVHVRGRRSRLRHLPESAPIAF